MARNPNILRIDEDYKGITKFLDATLTKHKGKDAKFLKENWNWGEKPHVGVSTLAFQYGVSWPTMDDWINRLHKEAGIIRPRRNQ